MAKRKKAKAATKTRKAKAKVPRAPKRERPDGSISSGIYDAVEKLMAGGTMKRTEAFRQLAKESGRNANTVAVNYYYAAKKRGAELRKRGPGRPKMATGARNGTGSSRIESVLKSLAELIRAQEAEITALRRDAERFAELRRLIG